MSNSFGQNYSFARLMKFAFPNIIMMIFLSLYTIVDGIFVSRYAGTIALSAVNIVYPIMCIELAIGIMLASGGSAVVAKRLGEGRKEKACEDFSFIVVVAVVTGIIIAVLTNLYLDEIVVALGASKLQFELCKQYAGILAFFAPVYFLQTLFQTFFVTAGKPVFGLGAMVGAGVTNMVLDYVFIGILQWGIAGAAVATVIGYFIPAILGIYFFSTARNKGLRFVKPKADWKMLVKSCANGSSEMVTNIANAITTFLFNYVFMKYYGEDGVAAITIILYFQFVFSAVFFGYAQGVAPIISFKYGAKDQKQLRSIVHNSFKFIAAGSVVSYLLSILVIKGTLRIFTAPDTNVYKISMEGFHIFALSFLFIGISIFASALFTAFSDGKTSAVISFSRTFLFLTVAMLVLPLLFGKTGVWLAVPLAEILGMLVTVFYLIRKKNYYAVK